MQNTNCNNDTCNICNKKIIILLPVFHLDNESCSNCNFTNSKKILSSCGHLFCYNNLNYNYHNKSNNNYKCPYCKKNYKNKFIIKQNIHIDCSICLNKINNPIALDCGHVYCFNCIDNVRPFYYFSNNKFIILYILFIILSLLSLIFAAIYL